MISLKFRLYDTATHSYYAAKDVRIDGTGQIWYNNSRSRTVAIWEPLHASGEGCELRNVILKFNDHTNYKKSVFGDAEIAKGGPGVPTPGL